MFLGQYHARVESKNRIAFPSKFREQIADRLIITYGFEQSLMIVPLQNWGNLTESLEKESFLRPEVRETELFLFGGATEATLDKQGRFILADYLREFAKIEKEVVFVGVRNYVRLWSQNIWVNYQELMRLQITEMARKLGESLNKEK